MTHDIGIRPRVSETDMLGHINNVAVTAWLEEGRSYMVREIARKPEDLPLFVVARLEIDYREQIFFGEEARVKSWVERIGNSSAVIAQEISQGGRLCVAGRSVVVYFDRAAQRSAPLPDWLRTGLGTRLPPGE